MFSGLLSVFLATILFQFKSTKSTDNKNYNMILKKAEKLETALNYLGKFFLPNVAEVFDSINN